MYAHRPLTAEDNVKVTAHFLKQMKAKGFDGAAVIEALRNPYKVTEVRRYPGQVRFCGGGLAVVVRPEDGVFHLITVYLDGVVTALRPDQMNDPAALNSRRLTGR